MLGVGMVTSWRSQPTITQSIRSLRAAWFYQPIQIFAEPHGRKYVPKFDETTVIYNTKKLWVCKNSHQVADRLSNSREHYSHFLIAQDDFIYQPNTFELLQLKLLEELDKNSFWYICLYTDKRNSREITQHRWNRLKKWWMTLGALYVFSRESWQKIKSHAFYRSHVFGTSTPTKRDCVVAETVRLLKLDARYHNPSLAAHIGITSTIGHHRHAKSTVKTWFRWKDIDNTVAL